MTTPSTIEQEELTNGALAEQGIYPGSVLPRSEHPTIGNPQHLAREAFLATDRNKWFLVTVGLSCVLAFVIVQYIHLSNASSTHREVIWVKLYGDGTWGIQPHDNHQSMEFLEATVNSILKQWVQRRFSQVPQTVLADYTYANYFLSPALTKEFTSPDGFHAARKAAELEECTSCSIVHYSVRTLDHYDQEVGKFANTEGTFYRTHLFVTATTSLPDGQISQHEQRIVRVQWRLMTPLEIHTVVQGKNGQEWLDHNPIGIEILAYHDMVDPSGTKSKGGGR